MTTSEQPNLITSRYTDLHDEPVDRHLAPITAYREVSQTSLEESLKLVSHLFMDLESYVWIAKENSKNPANGLTQDESASIHLYTVEFDCGPSLYQLLNKALRDINRQSVKLWNSFLKLFLTALHKLPSYSEMVWRGVRGEDLSSKYPIGHEFVCA